MVVLISIDFIKSYIHASYGYNFYICICKNQISFRVTNRITMLCYNIVIVKNYVHTQETF